MKRNSGFTLVELLAVIVIIAVLSSIGIISAIKVNKNVKTKEYESKISLIENAALLYSDRIISNIIGSNLYCKVENNKIMYAMEDDGTYFKCSTVTIDELILNGYLKSDKVVDEKEVLINPITKDEINSCNVFLYSKYGLIYAFYDKDTCNTSDNDIKVSSTELTQQAVYRCKNGTLDSSNNCKYNTQCNTGRTYCPDANINSCPISQTTKEDSSCGCISYEYTCPSGYTRNGTQCWEERNQSCAPGYSSEHRTPDSQCISTECLRNSTTAKCIEEGQYKAVGCYTAGYTTNGANPGKCRRTVEGTKTTTCEKYDKCPVDDAPVKNEEKCGCSKYEPVMEPCTKTDNSTTNRYYACTDTTYKANGDTCYKYICAQGWVLNAITNTCILE